MGIPFAQCQVKPQEQAPREKNVVDPVKIKDCRLALSYVRKNSVLSTANGLVII